MFVMFDINNSNNFRKNLSKNNSKSLATLRQKVRKYLKDFEDDLAKFKENPDLPDEEDEKGAYIITSI